jgi:hypothetical protein
MHFMAPYSGVVRYSAGTCRADGGETPPLQERGTLIGRDKPAQPQLRPQAG